jgi:hypothetical protein
MLLSLRTSSVMRSGVISLCIPAVVSLPHFPLSNRVEIRYSGRCRVRGFPLDCSRMACTCDKCCTPSRQTIRSNEFPICVWPRCSALLNERYVQFALQIYPTLLQVALGRPGNPAYRRLSSVHVKLACHLALAAVIDCLVNRCSLLSFSTVRT